MAMELDIIKTQTTWNDATASLNSNFAKIKKGIRDGIPVVNTPVDDTLSETSENAIQNKAVAVPLNGMQSDLEELKRILTEMETATIQPLYEK